MLRKRPNERLDLNSIKNHPWFDLMGASFGSESYFEDTLVEHSQLIEESFDPFNEQLKEKEFKKSNFEQVFSSQIDKINPETKGINVSKGFFDIEEYLNKKAQTENQSYLRKESTTSFKKIQENKSSLKRRNPTIIKRTTPEILLIKGIEEIENESLTRESNGGFFTRKTFKDSDIMSISASFVESSKNSPSKSNFCANCLKLNLELEKLKNLREGHKIEITRLDIANRSRTRDVSAFKFENQSLETEIIDLKNELEKSKRELWYLKNSKINNEEENLRLKAENESLKIQLRNRALEEKLIESQNKQILTGVQKLKKELANKESELRGIKQNSTLSNKTNYDEKYLETPMKNLTDNLNESGFDSYSDMRVSSSSNLSDEKISEKIINKVIRIRTGNYPENDRVSNGPKARSSLASIIVNFKLILAQ